jgi:hypothetical protein
MSGGKTALGDSINQPTVDSGYREFGAPGAAIVGSEGLLVCKVIVLPHFSLHERPIDWRFLSVLPPV